MNKLMIAFTAVVALSTFGCKKKGADDAVPRVEDKPTGSGGDKPAGGDNTGAAMDTGSGSAMAASRSAAATGSAAGAAGEAKPPCTATPTGKLVDATGELRYTLKNTSTRPWHYCNVYGFAYDKAGKFLGRGSMSSNVGLNPGEEQPASIQIRDDKDKPLAEPASAVYELVASDVFFDDKSEWKEKVDFYGHTKATGPTVRITK